MSDKRVRKASHSFQFNVAQLLKQPTGARRIYDLAAADVPSLDEAVKVAAPYHGWVRLTRIGTGILVTGELQTTVELECTHCLATFWGEMRFEVEEEFRPTLDIASGTWLPPDPDQDVATLIDEHHILDLAEVVRQNLLLSLPSSPICRPDCRGLCPYCGQNRNEGSCDCRTEEVDSRWAGLKASFEQ
jgi:uncharacterized protein